MKLSGPTAQVHPLQKVEGNMGSFLVHPISWSHDGSPSPSSRRKKIQIEDPNPVSSGGSKKPNLYNNKLAVYNLLLLLYGHITLIIYNSNINEQVFFPIFLHEFMNYLYIKDHSFNHALWLHLYTLPWIEMFTLSCHNKIMQFSTQCITRLTIE